MVWSVLCTVISMYYSYRSSANTINAGLKEFYRMDCGGTALKEEVRTRIRLTGRGIR